MGPSRRRDDREVNTAEQGDQKGREGYRYHRKQYSDQKERRPFRRPNNAEKWCEIHRTDGHDWEEYKIFLDGKKIPPPAAPAPKDPRQGEHHQEVSDGDEHMPKINMIFRGRSFSVKSA
jgi:hypothetical protein